MAKIAKITRNAVTGEFSAMPSTEERVESIKKAGTFLRNNPKALKRAALDLKIHTQGGKLTKRYGG